MKIILRTIYSLLFLASLVRPREYQVHMSVCSHLDAGWVNTFEQYYTGRGTGENENVKRIYDESIQKLDQNPEWTYAVSDISFFARWWGDQSEQTRNKVRDLVKKGQIELLNGGWVANDEATAYYEDIIENFRLGNRFLQREFGTCPKIGWQLDSFGTSATHAALLAQTGYEAMFFSRMHNIDRERRKAEKSLQFMWRPQNPRNESIFTHAFSVNYAVVAFLGHWASMFNIFAQNMSPMDYDQIDRFFQQEKNYFRTKDIFFPLCADFWVPQLQGMQSLVDNFRKRSNSQFDVKFSTASEFIKNVLGSVDVNTLPSKYGDFFPYNENDANSWTGYFTSKPTFKRFVRATSEHLQAMKVFAAKILFWRDNSEFENVSKKLESLQSISSIHQHHDAVTGTMKEFVKHDYERWALDAVKNLQDSLSGSFKAYLKAKFQETVTEDKLELQFVNQFMKEEGSLSLETLSGNAIPLSLSGKFTLACFNPGLQRTFLVKLKLPETNGKGISLLSQDNTKIEPDVICLKNRYDLEECWVYFMDTIPDFGFKLYKLVLNDNSLLKITPKTPRLKEVFKIYDNSHIMAQNTFGEFEYRHCPTKAQYDAYSSDSKDCTNVNFRMEYAYYRSGYPSGAYVMGFQNDKTEDLPVASFVNAYVGKHVTIYQFVRTDLDSFLLFKSLDTELPGFEVHTKVHSPSNERGREYILRLIDPEIKNAGSFFIDQNGYYATERKFGQLEGFTPNRKTDVRQNYFPMTALAYIKNDKKRLTLVTDRAQGASSTSEGEIEVMIQRTCLSDDAKGVNEVLYEMTADGKPAPATTRHFVLFTDATDSRCAARRVQMLNDRPVQYWVYKAESSQFAVNPSSSKPLLQGSTSSLKFSLFTPEPDTSYLTFQNINDHPAGIKLCNGTSLKSPIFNRLCLECDITVSAIQETTWNTLYKKTSTVKCGDTVSFLPMEIRTFKLSLKSNYNLNNIEQLQSQLDFDEYEVNPVIDPKDQEPKIDTSNPNTEPKKEDPPLPKPDEKPEEPKPKPDEKPQEPQPKPEDKPEEPKPKPEEKPEEPKPKPDDKPKEPKPDNQPDKPTKPTDPRLQPHPEGKPLPTSITSKSYLIIAVIGGVYLAVGIAFLPMLLNQSADLFKKARRGCSIFAYVVFIAFWPVLLIHSLMRVNEKPAEKANIEFQELDESQSKDDVDPIDA